MPDDRFLHPRYLNSQKVSELVDVEFRVWVAADQVSDDFGILQHDASTIWSKERGLRARHSVDVVQAALDRIVTLGLRLMFDHQGQRWTCAPAWQDFQKIRYPRQTYQPCPPIEVLTQCSVSTVRLFRDFHRGFPEVFPKEFWRKSGKVRALARAGARETANGIRLTANGSEGGGPGEPSGFERFWRVYPVRVGKDRAEAAWRIKRCERLAETILAAVEQQRAWLMRADPARGKKPGDLCPNPATWLNQGRWKDDPPPVEASGPRLSPRTAENAGAIQRLVARHT